MRQARPSLSWTCVEGTFPSHGLPRSKWSSRNLSVFLNHTRLSHGPKAAMNSFVKPTARCSARNFASDSRFGSRPSPQAAPWAVPQRPVQRAMENPWLDFHSLMGVPLVGLPKMVGVPLGVPLKPSQKEYHQKQDTHADIPRMSLLNYRF